MTKNLTDQAVQCLTCACANLENKAARFVLQVAEALTSAGGLAAVFIAESPEHERLVGAARRAIDEQRAWCRDRGPFRPHDCVTRRH